MNKTEIASKVIELVNGGMELSKALEAVLKPGGSRVQMTGEGRVEWISSLTSIADVKKATKVAFAKKSKAVAAGKPETIARYEQEIKAGQRRLTELSLKVDHAGDPVAQMRMALEMGEEPSGVVQRLLNSLDISEDLKNFQKKIGMPNAAFKELLNGQPSTTPQKVLLAFEDLGNEELITLYESRAKNNDQRIVTLNRGLNLLENQDEVAAKVVKLEGPAADMKEEKLTGMSAEAKADLAAKDHELAEDISKKMDAVAAKKIDKEVHEHARKSDKSHK